MHRAALTACVPWLAALAVLILLAYFLVRVSRGRLRLGRLLELHRDQAGGVQSLSFVLTLPIFIMVMMLIVQVSQLMIGVMVVHYAAFATARSAIVWIPADLSRVDLFEGPNCISDYLPDDTATDQAFPLAPRGELFWLGQSPRFIDNVGEGPTEGGVTYRIVSSGPKYSKIRSAAVLACMAISPSRPMGFSVESSPPLLMAGAPPGNTSAAEAARILEEAYRSMSPSTSGNSAVPERLRNKLAYSLNNTEVELRFFHQNFEPPLWTNRLPVTDDAAYHVRKINGEYYYLRAYLIFPDAFEFEENELGRQDLIIAKVTHRFALLPGPGRLLVRYGLLGPNARQDAETRGRSKTNVYDDTYSYAITASAALNLEGEKSVIPYVY